LEEDGVMINLPTTSPPSISPLMRNTWKRGVKVGMGRVQEVPTPFWCGWGFVVCLKHPSIPSRKIAASKSPKTPIRANRPQTSLQRLGKKKKKHPMRRSHSLVFAQTSTLAVHIA
jgi:hypothetical protein